MLFLGVFFAIQYLRSNQLKIRLANQLKIRLANQLKIRLANLKIVVFPSISLENCYILERILFLGRNLFNNFNE